MILSAQSLSVPGRLTGVSLALDPGDVTAICGPNGAGKSTLLASLAGLIPPSSGVVTLDGRPLAKVRARDRACMIGYLPQDGEIAWDLSVAALVRLGRLPHRTGPLVDDPAVDHALATLDLTAFADRPVQSLSGGERARALLARVLAGQPRWVLADEPLAALDLGHQQALLARFRELAATRGGAGEQTGVVLVLHDLAHAMNHADRVIVLRDGMVIADGPPETALSETVIAQAWGVTASWLGDPGARALIVSR